MEHSEHHKDNDHKIKESVDSDSEVDIHVNVTKIKKFFTQKHINILILILLILIPAVLTLYVRLEPQYLPATQDMARNAVDNYYKNGIAQQINAQYPNLPTQQKQKLIDDQFAQFQKTNKDQMAQQVQQTAAYFKTGFQYQENNHTYTFLGDLDSYYYLRQARNIETKGTICDEIKNNTCWDSYLLAPLGAETAAYLHPYGIVFVYKIFHTLSPSINLMQASFLVPVILGIIVTIATFFVGRRLMNNAAGFFAAMFIALSPLFITRTAGSDTDIWNILLPVLIIWVFLEAFESKTWVKRVTFTVITALLLGLFSFAWAGYWYMMLFIIAAIVGFIIFETIREYMKHKHIKKIFNEEVKNSAIMLLILVITTGIFVSLFTSFETFKYSFVAPFDLNTNLKSAAQANLWPNVFTTVAELNEASISTIIGQTAFGINILFSLALLGIVFTLVKRQPDFKEYLLIGFSIIMFLILLSPSLMNGNSMLYLLLLCVPVAIATIMLIKEKDDSVDVKTAFLLMIWFVGMIYASIKGVRFILLLIPTFSIALGVALGYIYQYLQRLSHEDLKIPEKISKVAVFLVLCLILIWPIQIGIATGKNFMPSMTKGWWDSLTKIREESKSDAIINSWWDFGHWFKYVADRRVTLDGVSQNHPNAHWLGLTLQTNNENMSVAILRMLDCGSNNAFEEINTKYNDTEKSENIVSEILNMSREDAQKELLGLGYANDEVQKILNYTHCNPPEDYFITSEDMVGKSGVWAHFGLWNFDKAFIINNLRGKGMSEATSVMKERWNYTDDEATKIYYDVQALQTDREMNDWIAPWPSYATGRMVPCVNISEMVLCDLGLNIGGNSQQSYVIERAVVNLSDPAKSQVLVSVYSTSTGTKLGESIAEWSQVYIADDTLKKYTPTNVTLGLGFLLDINREGNQTTYSGLVADPLLIDSTFTKLFFLDGKYTTRFEKFSDVSDITGTRIIIWKVKW